MTVSFPTARETARAIAAGTLTAQAALQACLATIDARDPAIGAWHVLAREQALEQAQAYDRAAARADKPPPLGALPSR